MNTPISIGWPQLILLVLVIVGVGLLISSVVGVFGRRDEDDERLYSGRKYRARRRFKLRHGIGGLVLLGAVVSLIWVAISVQAYLGLTGEIQVAQVRATQIDGQPHMMSVEVILYDKDGNQSSDKTYLMQGDEWILQGDIIKFPSWMNIVGIHSGYKLTRLEGRFDDIDMERNSKHSVIELNGGDDNFFKTVQQQAWVSPVIEAAYGNAVFLAPDGKMYNVFVSQTGLLAKPAK